LSYFHGTFAILESSLRKFLKSIDPEACEKGTAAFESIYKCLLKELSLQEYIPLLDLFRIFRNVIHNNGYYFHKSGNSQTITYKDEIYNFEIGKQANGLKFSILTELIKNDLCELYVGIVEHPKISSKDFIHDLGAAIPL
jgi:hypothetical protein